MNIKFLTSNPHKASHFSLAGLQVESFIETIPEIYSPDVELVALYKAKHAKIDNIVVEDTSLEIQGSSMFGTLIKHVLTSIKSSPELDNTPAQWKVSLCMRVGDNFYSATSTQNGILKYPVSYFGYGFDCIFAVEHQNKHVHFSELSEPLQRRYNPRFNALSKLTNALNLGDYSNLKQTRFENLPEWGGTYQTE